MLTLKDAAHVYIAGNHISIVHYRNKHTFLLLVSVCEVSYQLFVLFQSRERKLGQK